MIKGIRAVSFKTESEVLFRRAVIAANNQNFDQYMLKKLQSWSLRELRVEYWHYSNSSSYTHRYSECHSVRLARGSRESSSLVP